MGPIRNIREATVAWGSTEQERTLEFACDRYVADADATLFRAVGVQAPAAVLFRWLCQLRVAPYSYDWIDNRGRRSPRTLTPGLEHLEIGERWMTIFKLAEFEPDRHITLVLTRRSSWFGDLAITYLIVPVTDVDCRLVAKLTIAYPRSPIGVAGRRLLPAGDLVMMRRQLLTLKALAERDASMSA